MPKPSSAGGASVLRAHGEAAGPHSVTSFIDPMGPVLFHNPDVILQCKVQAQAAPHVYIPQAPDIFFIHSAQ